MKVYISADIEGTTCTTHWDETEHAKTGYEAAREQMTAEVAAACEGLADAGINDVWVKDAHASGRNLLAPKLPETVRLVRGWSGHPFSMVQELDDSFGALLLVGYHSRAGSDANPLAHTMTGRVALLRINDEYVSEFLLHAYAAAYRGVPVVFVSGDEGLCEDVKRLSPHTQTVGVKRGVGGSTISIHPDLAVERIRAGAAEAVRGDVSRCLLQLPETFRVEVTYRKHAEAYRCSFYPGAEQTGPYSIRFETDDYFEVMRLGLFVL